MSLENLVSLLALTTGQRVQILANIEIANIGKSIELATIKIPSRLKSSAPKRCQPSLYFPFYKETNICAVRILQLYLVKTKSLRSTPAELFFFSLLIKNRIILQHHKRSAVDQDDLGEKHETRGHIGSSANEGEYRRSKTFGKFYQPTAFSR